MIHIPEIKDSSVFRKINNHAVLILDFRNQMIQWTLKKDPGKRSNALRMIAFQGSL